jgi:hypothetical protein
MPNEASRLPAERLPEPRSVLVQMMLTPRSGATVAAEAAAPPGAAPEPRYRILRTLEVDEYEPPVAPAEIMALAAERAAPADNIFHGTARRAAKLSIVDAATEQFDDVSVLINTLPDHETMAGNVDITTDADNDRVPEERRNVRVPAFLYAASMEGDNDFHLIIGRDPRQPQTYMTAEVSGLPPENGPSSATLSAARGAYLEFFGTGLPGATYDFYDPPIPLEIEGSLFWDASHARGGRPGPSKLRPHMPVVWEIHPVTKITFEP